jgi:hypothetical protein
MSKHLTRRDRKRRKKKALTRERQYLRGIEEKMLAGVRVPSEGFGKLAEVMAASIYEELRRPSSIRSILQVTPVTTKETS